MVTINIILLKIEWCLVRGWWSLQPINFWLTLTISYLHRPKGCKWCHLCSQSSRRDSWEGSCVSIEESTRGEWTRLIMSLRSIEMKVSKEILLKTSIVTRALNSFDVQLLRHSMPRNHRMLPSRLKMVESWTISMISFQTKIKNLMLLRSLIVQKRCQRSASLKRASRSSSNWTLIQRKVTRISEELVSCLQVQAKKLRFASLQAMSSMRNLSLKELILSEMLRFWKKWAKASFPLIRSLLHQSRCPTSRLWLVFLDQKVWCQMSRVELSLSSTSWSRLSLQQSKASSNLESMMAHLSWTELERDHLNQEHLLIT